MLNVIKMDLVIWIQIAKQVSCLEEVQFKGSNKNDAHKSQFQGCCLTGVHFHMNSSQKQVGLYFLVYLWRFRIKKLMDAHGAK